MPDLPGREAYTSRSRPDTRDGTTAALLAGLAAALVTVIVYRDVLQAYFWNDDFAWLFVLRERGLGDFLLTPMGGHSLVARNAVIALLDAVVGLDPRPWFVTVLATHALNVVLLARLIWLVTGSVVLGGIAAMAWGICPAASGTLAWYSVYGQAAATTCLLAAFGRVAVRAQADDALSRRDLVVIAAWLVLSSVLFGTALAVALILPVAIALLLPRRVTGRRGLRSAFAISTAVLAVYAALQAIGAGGPDGELIPLQLLGWLTERWWPAVIALVQLVRVGVTSLLLGAWWAPDARSDTVSWATLGLAGVFWAAALWRASARLRGTVLAFVAVALTIYALIAIARGPLAGPLLGQTSAQVAAILRYHYVPQLFLTVGLAASLCALLPAPRRARARSTVAVGWGLVLLTGQLRHGAALDLHDASRLEIARALDTLRTALAATPPGSTAELQNAPIAAFGWLPNTTEQPPGLAGLFVIAFPDDRLDGRTLRFIEPDARIRESARRRAGRTATLLVPPPGS